MRSARSEATPGIPVRRMKFAFPESIDPVFVRGCPEESFIYLGVSLVLPHLEPYLIRTLRLASAQLDDPVLQDQIKRFNGQEGQHYRQHMAFNRATGMLDLPALQALDREIAADYERFSESRSLRFNLAYAEGFEAATAALGLMVFKAELFDEMDPDSADLLRWHVIEELEHRTVAFDVYERLVGDTRYRLRVALFAHRHLAGFALRAARALMDAHPELRSASGPHAPRPGRRRAFAKRLGWHFLPRLLGSYLPSYRPHGIPLPEGFHDLAARYSERAVGLS